MVLLITLLVLQAMITPIAATAQGTEVSEKDANTEVLDGMSNSEESVEETEVEDPNVSEDKELLEEDSKVDDEVVNDSEDLTEELTEEADNEELSSASKPQVNVVKGVTQTIIEAVEITEDILFDVEIVIENEKGEQVESAGPDTVISVNYKWKIENGHSYGAGSTYSFQLPKELEVYETVTNEEMIAPNGKKVGEFSVAEDGKVTITFTDYIEDNSNLSGTLEVLTELSKDIVVTEDKQITVTPLDGKDSIEIPIDYTPGGPAIEKKGTPNKEYNASTIEWTVDFNKTLQEVQQAKLSDPIQTGQELQEGSIKLYHLITKLDGTVEQGELVDPNTYTVGKTADGEDFVIDFNRDINTAYRAVYTTNITDDDQKDFKNKAVLQSGNDKVAEAEATVNVGRGHPIDKSGNYDPATQTITWTVKYNYNEKKIPQEKAYLTDAFLNDNNHELVKDSFVVKNVSIDENNEETIGSVVDENSYTVTTDNIDIGELEGAKNPLFTFQFNDDIDSAYIIEYKTKAEDRVFEDGQVQNRIYLEDGGYSTNNQNVKQHILLKTNSEDFAIDYNKKVVFWTIEFNKDKHEMENVVLKDVFTNGGLTLIPDTVEISGLEEGVDYQVVPNDADGFDIRFLKTITEAHTIKYQTNFDYEQRTDKDLKYLQNKATLEWTNPGSDEVLSKDATSNFTPNEYTQAGGYKNSSYNAETQEITWDIVFNYNEQKLADATIEDFITQSENLTVDLNSIEVYKLQLHWNGSTITKEELVDSNLYEKKIIDEDGKQGFQIKFKDEITDTYRITYKTSLKDLTFVEKAYDNNATVTDGDKTHSDLNASVSIPHGGKYTTKSGEQDGKIVDWKVDINFSQSKVVNASITDTPSDNQSTLEQSFHLYETTVASDGEVTKGDELTRGEDYTIEFTEDPYSFELKFKNEINEPYILEYQSLILAKVGDKVKNDLTFAGEKVEEGETTSSSSEIEVRRTTGSGTGAGEVGQLTVTKTDAVNGTLLPGAVFSLKDPESGTIIKTDTTDENGEISFGRLLYGNYLLIEEEAPEGYQEESEPIEITIDSPYEKDNEEKQGDQETITNEKLIYAVQLEKIDSKDSNKKLAEATFELQQKVNDMWEKVDTLSTNDEGIILKEGLKAGDYRFVETKAPTGYILSNEPIEFTIKDTATEMVELTATNAARGIVQLIKTDKDTGDELQGVEFVLEKENNSGGYDTVATFTTDKNGLITTSNTLEAGNYQFVETEGLDGYRTNRTPVKFTVNINSTETQEFTMENEKYKGSIKLVKTDQSTDQELEGAEFKLIDSKGEVVEENLETNKLGEILIDDLLLGKYQLIETKAPAGYELDETPIDIEITEDNQVIEKTMTNNKITDITVEKKWNNNGGDTEPVTIKLLPTDKTVELNDNNNWKATFEDLDVYAGSGEAIDYQVEELAIDGYNSKITGDASNGFVVTNTETTSVSVEKTWKDDDSAERPDQITVQLLADGTKVKQKEITVNNDWKYEFADLDKYGKDGEEITYTIEEVEVAGYETKIDGFNIENVRVGTTSVEGEKTWKDENSTDRPKEITVNLSREIDGTVDEGFSESKTVTPNSVGEWTYEFKDLDEFDKNGVAYTYTIEEDNVPKNYESIVNGYDITNVRIGEIEVSGTKHWKDDKVADRPNAIKVNLLRNDVVIDTKEVTLAEDWEYTFTKLDKYDGEGQLYDYTVKEQDVGGYDSKVKGHDITNTRSEQKSIEVTKGWLDDDSKDRPDFVIVYLYQNGDLLDTEEIKADNDWKYKFTNLAAYDKDGQPYEYTVKEKPVDGYETTVDGFNITNLLIGKTEVSGEKIWNEVDESYRPDTITVQLLANGEEESTIEASAKTNWSYGFTGLDKYDDQGKEIVYTVEELEIPTGYESKVDGYDIINKQEVTKVSGTKIWLDDDSENRPDSITVQVKNGDEIVAEQVITADDDWQYTFSNLAKYDKDGKEIDYTIDEKVVAGYEKLIEGNNITNLRIGKISIAGTKTWKDTKLDDRPSSITVELLQNGGKIDEVKVTAKSDWEYSFTDLEEFDENGVAYEYTVNEQEVDGYTASIDGYDITNTSDTYLLGDGGEKDEDIDGSQAAGDGGNLPETATNIYNLTLIGFGLMLVGLILFFARRKRIE